MTTIFDGEKNGMLVTVTTDEITVRVSVIKKEDVNKKVEFGKPLRKTVDYPMSQLDSIKKQLGLS